MLSDERGGVRFYIGGMLRCCVAYLEAHGAEAEQKGATSLVCELCDDVLTRDAEGMWRWDAAATVQRDEAAAREAAQKLEDAAG